ncbi:hypothetical protein COCOBI_05-4070 [Coccomyxa sp. Obi]|nr:hypothetical protein COCOBI_05-4070 [Coccomyxa sp. Obi]
MTLYDGRMEAWWNNCRVKALHEEKRLVEQILISIELETWEHRHIFYYPRHSTPRTQEEQQDQGEPPAQSQEDQQHQDDQPAQHQPAPPFSSASGAHTW